MSSLIVDVLFAIVFLLVVVVVIALPRLAGISLRRFSIPSLFIIFYLISSYSGILVLYFGWDPYPVSLGVTNREIILELFMYSSTALILSICGFIYAHHVVRLNSIDVARRVLMGAGDRARLFVLCVTLLSLLILMLYLRKVDTIALFHALDGDIAAAAISRSEMGNAFEGKYWRYQLFFRTILDFCVVFFLADYLTTRRIASAIGFGAAFFAAVFSATMAIEKGPFVYLLLMLYLTYVIYRGGNYWQPLAKYFVILAIGVIALLYIYFLGAADIASALKFLFWRTITGSITPAYFYLELFPKRIDYLWGASFPNPAGLFPFENFPLTKEVSRIVSPEAFALGITGSAPTVFWAEMYANFGAIGVIASSFLVGIGMFVISHVLSLVRLSPSVIAATVSVAMHYKTLSGTSLSNYFIDTTLTAIVLVTLISLLLSKRGILIRRKISRRRFVEIDVNAN